MDLDTRDLDTVICLPPFSLDVIEVVPRAPPPHADVVDLINGDESSLVELSDSGDESSLAELSDSIEVDPPAPRVPTPTPTPYEIESAESVTPVATPTPPATPPATPVPATLVTRKYTSERERWYEQLRNAVYTQKEKYIETKWNDGGVDYTSKWEFVESWGSGTYGSTKYYQLIKKRDSTGNLISGDSTMERLCVKTAKGDIGIRSATLEYIVMRLFQRYFQNSDFEECGIIPFHLWMCGGRYVSGHRRQLLQIEQAGENVIAEWRYLVSNVCTADSEFVHSIMPHVYVINDPQLKNSQYNIRIESLADARYIYSQIMKQVRCLYKYKMYYYDLKVSNIGMLDGICYLLDVGSIYVPGVNNPTPTYHVWNNPDAKDSKSDLEALRTSTDEKTHIQNMEKLGLLLLLCLCSPDEKLREWSDSIYPQLSIALLTSKIGSRFFQQPSNIRRIFTSNELYRYIASGWVEDPTEKAFVSDLLQDEISLKQMKQIISA